MIQPNPDVEDALKSQWMVRSQGVQKANYDTISRVSKFSVSKMSMRSALSTGSPNGKD